MSKLKDGLILAYTDCPYREECGEYGKQHCKQNGVEHKVDFSCAFARAHDLINERKV